MNYSIGADNRHFAQLGCGPAFLKIAISLNLSAYGLTNRGDPIINDAVIKYGAGVEKQLRDAGYRVELDSRNETIGKKIREAEMQKIPYLLIIGNKEAEARTVAVRARGKGDIGQMTLDAFSAILTKETTNH